MITWITVNPRIGPSYDKGLVGKIKMFSVGWSTAARGDSEKPYLAETSLPGFTSEARHERFATIDEGKDWCETRLKMWLKEAGLTIA